jgi:pimeloyl-ACP methyl ester carboxylesterase
MSLPIERGLAKTFAGHIHWRACRPKFGEGPVVMLGHINQQSSALMVELLQALGSDFRAIAIDYPSHGNSDHIDWQPRIEDYARCVIEVMDALGIDRAFAMGEAVGAAVSIALGSRWPSRIDKVVLINTPYFVDAGTAKKDIADIARVRPSDPTGFPAPRSIEFLLTNDPEHAPMQPTQSWMDRINTAQFEIGRDRWQAMGALEKFDTLAGMSALACPVLMLYGEHFIYSKHRALLQSKCPQARVEIVPGGRFCMSWERAIDVADRARQFLM